MSVLNFPRIYFNGKMEWNPPTANNNDVFPLYDAANVELNWGFLADLNPPVTRENVREKLHPWMLKDVGVEDIPKYVSQVPGNSQNFPMMPAEWDLFGDNACGPVDYMETRTTVIGGQTEVDNYVSSDPLLKMDFQISGNPLGGTNPTPGRFVDISPWENTFTALYFDQLQFGDENTGLLLKREYRMLDRFLNFNWGAVNGLHTVTTTWQTCFPRENIIWYEGESVLLQALRAKLEADPSAKGLMVRFSTYLIFYDKNGIFNDYPKVISHGSDTSELKALYRKALDNSSDIFFNPAYSNLAGSVGLWYDNEFPTVPGGRRLQSGPSDSPVKVTGANGEVPIPLGVTLVQLDGTTLSLDVSNTFPFKAEDPSAPIPVSTKFDLGSFSIGVNNNGTVTELATIDYSDYSQDAFDMRSGCIDVTISENDATLFDSGTLQVIELSSGNIVLTEELRTAEIIGSGIFLDVGEEKTLNIMLQNKGKPIAEGTKIWITQYGNPYNITTSDYFIGFDDPDNNVDFVLYSIDEDGNSKAKLPQFSGSDPLTPLKEDVVQTGQVTRANVPQGVNTLLSSAPQVKEVTYKEVLSSPVGLSLESHVSLIGGQTINKTLNDVSKTPVSYQAVQVEANDKGIAQVTIKGVSAGFPALLFSFSEEPEFVFSFGQPDAYKDSMAPIRVLPSNENLVQDFVNKWNEIYQEENAAQIIWDEFVYPNVLEVFYYLYPIMDKYMPLDELSRVEGAVDQLIVLISKEYRNESTLAMPITRDLPSSSRAVLELWGTKLVKLNYPPRPLSLS